MKANKPLITYIKNGKEVKAKRITKKHLEAIYAKKSWEDEIHGNDFRSWKYHTFHNDIDYISFENIVFSPVLHFFMSCLNKDTLVLFDHCFFTEGHHYELAKGNYEFNACEFDWNPEIKGTDVTFFSINNIKGKEMERLTMEAEEILLQDMRLTKADLKADKISLCKLRPHEASAARFDSKELVLNNTVLRGLLEFGPTAKQLVLNNSDMVLETNRRIVFPQEKVILTDSVMYSEYDMTIEKQRYHSDEETNICEVDDEAKARASLIATLKTVKERAKADLEVKIKPYKENCLIEREEAQEPYFKKLEDISNWQLHELVEIGQRAYLKRNPLQQEIERINELARNQREEVKQRAQQEKEKIQVILDQHQSDYENKVTQKAQEVYSTPVKKLLKK